MDWMISLNTISVLLHIIERLYLALGENNVCSLDAEIVSVEGWFHQRRTFSIGSDGIHF
jgi:hypothetical protein